MAGKQRSFTLNIGTSSIIFIFVILALVSFAVLSLATSMSDYNLARNVSDNTTAYYNACNEVEELLAQTDRSLKSLYDTGISRASYFEQSGKKRTFAYPVSDIQTLEVEIKILYPENPGDPFYEVTLWQISTTGSLEYDSHLPVLQ